MRMKGIVKNREYEHFRAPFLTEKLIVSFKQIPTVIPPLLRNKEATYLADSCENFKIPASYSMLVRSTNQMEQWNSTRSLLRAMDYFFKTIFYGLTDCKIDIKTSFN